MPARKRRPKDLSTRDLIAGHSVVIVGLDGIGRQLAFQLAALGIGRLLLVDAGKVTRRGAATNGYFADDIGRPKRHAAAELCHRVNPALDVHTATRMNPRRLTGTDVLFCCGQSPAAERLIWDTAGRHVGCWISVRAEEHGVRVAVAKDARTRAAYGRMLDREARQPPPELHLAALAAGLTIGAFIRLLSGQRPRAHLHFDPDSVA